MATMTMQLSEADMCEAVKEWLEKQGFKVTGDVTLSHDPGDPGDPRSPSGGSFTASAPVERVVRKRGAKEAG